MKGHMEKDKRYFLPCRCGCGVLAFEREEKDKYYEQDIVYIEYYPVAFYAHQHPIRQRLKAIWNLIRGKEYRLFDIFANYGDFKELADKLEKAQNDTKTMA
jgi:hypothetical protein